LERTTKRLAELSRVLSHALRHEPWQYDIEIDASGWVGLPELIEMLRTKRPEWSDLTEADLEDMIRDSSKGRHEIHDGRIRALYGHSIPGRLVRSQVPPPEMLYHGTSGDNVESIKAAGLQPMRRQHVHLSIDAKTAAAVGRRKASVPVVLRVRAAEAHLSGVVFYAGNDETWLADNVPWKFIDISTPPDP
jgi:putative RNA 2'-phosphotransferase